MPHQNRVDPFGDFHPVEARGTLMGNRGILHDGKKRLLRTHAHRNWITCALAFKGRQRTIMAPRRYTELFFLDEATAFAAGHRPCAECRRERYKEFTAYWRDAHGEPEVGRSLAQAIDRKLHAHRIARGGRKITFEAAADDLPSGTLFAVGEQPVLLWKGRQFDWSFHRYEARAEPAAGTVRVLSPRPLVELFSRGLQPLVHESVSL